MDDQLLSYLESNTPTGPELFVISRQGVNNDFVAGQSDPSLPAAAVKNIAADLISAGARNVLITNLILARVPNSKFSEQFNDLLSTELESLRLTSPESIIYELDAAQVFADILADPQDFESLT